MTRIARQPLTTTAPARFNKTIIAQAVALSLAALSTAAYAADVCTTASTTISATQGMGDNCNLVTGESLTVNTGVNAFTGVIAGVEISGAAVAGSITNNGTISGNSTGIRIHSGSSVASITNNGTISGGSYGLIVEGGTVSGNITNSGTISGNSYGIYIRSSSSVTGGITNSGTISGNSRGIYINNSSSVTGGITNSGIISGNSYGIYISNSSSVTGGITNSGTIDGGNSAGIYISNSSSVTGSITNSGTISGNSTGIRIRNGSSVTGAINNSGTISGASNGIYMATNASVGSITNTNTGTIISGNGIGITVRNNASVTGAIDNSGTISGASYGIFVRSNASVGSITNSGTISAGSGYGVVVSQSTVSGNISNSGTISGQYSGIGVWNNSHLGGSITNSGTITANYAIWIGTGSSVGGGITNNAGGTISGNSVGIGIDTTVTGAIINNGTIHGNSTGIQVRSNGSVGSITNSGTISGSTNAINIYNSGHVTGGITNTGTILGHVKLNDATLNLDGTAGVLTGNVSGNSGSTVNVNGTFTSGGTFSVESFNVASTGIFTMGHAISTAGVSNAGKFIAGSGTHTITGDYTQSASGMLGTQVVSDVSYGKLVVTGTADLTASNKVYVDVVGTPSLTNGAVLADIISAGTLNAGTLTVTDNSQLFNFDAVVDGNTIDLTIKPGITATSSVAGQNGGSGTGAAGVFDDLIANGGGSADMNTVITALGTLGTAQQVSDAIQQTLPAMTAGMSEVNKGARHGVNRVVQSWQNGRGQPSGDEFLGDRMFWLKPLGSWTDQGDRKGVSGFSADTYGAVGGVDGEISDKTRIGLAFAYTHTNVDGNSAVAAQSASTNSYQGIVYGTVRLDENTDLDLQADIGLNKNKSSRIINFGGLNRVAASDYDSWSGHIGAGLSRSYTIQPGTVLTPGIRVDYTRIHDQSYTETGAGGLSLAVNSNNTDELILMAEGRVAHSVSDKATLTANLGVGYDVLSDRTAVTAAFTGGGAAFTTQGLDPSAVLVRGGAGLVVTNSSALEITARYDFEVRQDFDNQTASLKFRLPF